MKSFAPGHRDNIDADNLLRVGDRATIVRHLEEIQPTLPQPLQLRVCEFLRSNSSSD